MNPEKLDSRDLSLKVWYGSGFTRREVSHGAAGEAEREGLKFWQKNLTPLLVESQMERIAPKNRP